MNPKQETIGNMWFERYKGISSGRGDETKLSKFQQIDAKNVKNIQDVIHVPSPWILKGKKLGTCGLEGINGSLVEPPEVD